MVFGINRFFRRRYAPAWLTLALGLAGSGWLGWELDREAVELDRQRLARRIKVTVDELDGRLEKTELLLLQLQDYLVLGGETRDQLFKRWCNKHGLPFNFPWLHGIAVATNRHESTWRRILPEPSETWTESDWKVLLELAGQQPIEYDIAMQSSPRQKKRFLADYGLKASMVETNQFARSLRGSGVKISGRRPVMLDARSNTIAGCLFYVPVHDVDLDDLVARTPQNPANQVRGARWLHLTSLIVAPLDPNALEKAVWGSVARDLGVEMFSSTNQTADTWLNVSEGGPRAMDPKLNAYLTHRQPWPMYGRKFSIFFYTTPLFEAESPRRLARIVLTAGTGMTLLASALVGVALHGRNRQELLTDQIRSARDALATAQRERERLSRDLHDGTVQSLYAVQLGLSHTIQKLEAEPANARRELATVGVELDGIIAEIRRFITVEESEERLVDFGGVLRAMVERARARTKAPIEVRCDPGVAERLSSSQAVQLANICSEALSNSLRHAQAQRVEITFRSESETAILEIADDGAGFDPRAPAKPGVGLTSMAARAHEMGGTLHIQSSPTRGTCVLVRIPVSPPEPDGAKHSTEQSDQP